MIRNFSKTMSPQARLIRCSREFPVEESRRLVARLTAIFHEQMINATTIDSTPWHELASTGCDLATALQTTLNQAEKLKENDELF